jgi:hypothetical protein
MRNLVVNILFLLIAVASGQLVQPSNNTHSNSTSPGDIVLAFQNRKTVIQPITLLPLLPTGVLAVSISA